MSDDPARGLAALYPSAKPDAATPGTTTPKAAAAPLATSPASVTPKASTGATKPVATSPVPASPGTAAQPAKAAQPDPSRDPAAAIYAEPMKSFAEVVAATPIPDEAAEHFDQGEEGKAAREAVRSAFLASGASKEETAELWNIAVSAARPDARITTADEAERELREAWQGNYEARLASVRAFFKGVAQKHPAVADEVRKLGLDNSAAFLKALHRASARRGR